MKHTGFVFERYIVRVLPSVSFFNLFSRSFSLSADSKSSFRSCVRPSRSSLKAAAKISSIPFSSSSDEPAFGVDGESLDGTRFFSLKRDTAFGEFWPETAEGLKLLLSGDISNYITLVNLNIILILTRLPIVRQYREIKRFLDLNTGCP